MVARYLFGPVTARFAQVNLQEHCAGESCLAFDAVGRLPSSITDADCWETVLRRLPAGWLPDFIVLQLRYATIPQCLWSAPIPIVGLADDWNLLWHAYRRLLPHVDLVLTDTVGVERLAQEGIHHAMAANLFGLEGGWLPESDRRERNRDIDVLFVGNLQHAVQRERLAWLGRLALLGKRWNVHITQAMHDDKYRELARRARIVFNRSIRGECNLRVFEAAAAGALLCQEEGNREIADYFKPGQECVFYNEQNFESVIEHYLEHEDERQAIADAAHNRVSEFTFARLWQQQVNMVERDLPLLQERARKRCAAARSIDLTGRLWQALGSGHPGCDTNLQRDLARCCGIGEGTDGPGSPSYEGRLSGDNTQRDCADLQNSLGMALTVSNIEGVLPRAGEVFARAVQSNGNHLAARLNLVEALAMAGQRAAAIKEGQRALAVLQGEGGASSRRREIESGGRASEWLDAPHFPVGFDFFRVEWERAAWQHAGDRNGELRAKRQLIRWRLHHLLGGLTGELAHYFEAVLARPDLPTTRAALGCALARAGQAELAKPHLRFAVTQDPFDLAAARAFFQALKDTGDNVSQRQFIRERRLLFRAAPRSVPEEPWFTETVAQ